MSDYGVHTSRIRVVGIGHNPRAESSPSRDWTQPRYLFVGIEWERKNGPRLLRAFARVRSLIPGARLDIVGGHPCINQPGVHTHGLLSRSDSISQAKLDALYANSTVFVLASLFEPAGIAYLEAASTGLPIIATANGGAPTFLFGGTLIVDPKNTEELTEAMLRLADPVRAQSLGNEAAAFARSMAWDSVADRMVRGLFAA